MLCKVFQLLCLFMNTHVFSIARCWNLCGRRMNFFSSVFKSNILVFIQKKAHNKKKIVTGKSRKFHGNSQIGYFIYYVTLRGKGGRGWRFVTFHIKFLYSHNKFCYRGGGRGKNAPFLHYVINKQPQCHFYFLWDFRLFEEIFRLFGGNFWILHENFQVFRYSLKL